MKHMIEVDEMSVTMSPREKAVRGRRPLFSQIVMVDGQPGMFIPLLQREEREVIEDWINSQEEPVESKQLRTRKVAHAI